jgi:hypothetical protein
MRAERLNAVAKLLGVALVAAGAGVVVARLETAHLGSVAPWTLWWMLLAATVWILARGAVRVLSGEQSAGAGTQGLGSVILAAGTLAAVLLPGAQLLLGTSQLRLATYGLDPPDLDSALSAAFTVFLVALLAFWAGERIAARVPARPPKLALRPPKLAPVADERLTYVVLVIASLVVHLAAPSAGLEDRAALGHGVTNVLGWGIPLAIALGIVKRHWGSRALAATSLCLFFGIVLQLGTRSPLFLIGIAVAHRLISGARRHRRPLGRAALLVLLVYLAATAAIGVSAWRYQVSHQQSASLVNELADAAANPFHDLSTRAQLDSLEGLVLSMQVDRSHVQASWLDPTKALINFVPRQLWPGKPQWLGPEVTHSYLNVGGNAGVFLSGPGYAWIVFGGMLGVIGTFLVLGWTTQRLYSRRALAEGGALLVSYFCLRFFFGGDAFDLFQVLGLAGLLWLARRAGGLLGQLLGRPLTLPARDVLP